MSAGACLSRTHISILIIVGPERVGDMNEQCSSLHGLWILWGAGVCCSQELFVVVRKCLLLSISRYYSVDSHPFKEVLRREVSFFLSKNLILMMSELSHLNIAKVK